MKTSLYQFICLTVLGVCAPACIYASNQVQLMPEKPIADQGKTVPSSPQNAAGQTAQTTTSDSNKTGQDNYPLVDRMEIITFGKSKTSAPIQERLTTLEQAVFKLTFADQSLFDRTQRLKLAILGADEATVNDSMDVTDVALPPLISPPGNSFPAQSSPTVTYFETLANNANNQITVPRESLLEFALEQINFARAQVGVTPLKPDKVAIRMADEQINDLSQRKIVSHTNKTGENPDLRYTALGGTGAINESIVCLKGQPVISGKYTRAIVAHALKLFMDHQDDREALLSPDATGFGFALSLLPGENKAVICTEISTTHGAMEPLSLPVKLGDKIEVKGNIEEPYKFFRFSLAWEGRSNTLQAASDETDEALPYFPPLDYICYAHRSEHDYSGAMTAIRMGALVGVIAGSMFMPPVALAAPLLVIGPGPGEPKPMSDIPLHGGVKVSGNNFSGKVNVSNGGKKGIYYLTVWATSTRNAKPVPISRRAFVVDDGNNTVPIANAKTES